MVLERAHGENHVTDLAEQVLSAIALPYEIDGRELTMTASAGIVFDHDRTNTGEILLRNADIAMYRAKTRGRRQAVVFETEMHTASFDRLEMRADLARAITSEQFLAHYQPVVDIESRRIVGAEALIRWDHPQRGLVGPGLFIPLAEETGMISALGEWILDRACNDLAAWRADFGEPMMDFTISVNLSVQQLHDDLIVTTVSDTLRRAGLPAERLVLEVTESTLITETDKIRATMQQLRAMGSRLAVDDFGTGYSSLGYIQQFDFDVLKIDKSFVDGLETGTSRQIVSAVLELARELGRAHHRRRHRDRAAGQDPPGARLPLRAGLPVLTAGGRGGLPGAARGGPGDLDRSRLALSAGARLVAVQVINDPDDPRLDDYRHLTDAAARRALESGASTPRDLRRGGPPRARPAAGELPPTAVGAGLDRQVGLAARTPGRHRPGHGRRPGRARRRGRVRCAPGRARRR